MSLVARRRNGKKSCNRQDNGHHATAFKRPDTVHLNNLPPDVQESEIIDLLEIFGPIEDILIHKLRPQQQILDGKEPFTFAFVNFINKADASRCIESGIPMEIRGKQISFNVRKPATKKITTTDEKQAHESITADPPEKNFLSIDPWPTNRFEWTQQDEKKKALIMSPLAKALQLPTVPISPGQARPESEARPDSSIDSSFSLIVNVNSKKPCDPVKVRGNVTDNAIDNVIDNVMDKECKSIMLADRIPSSWTSQEFYQRVANHVPDVSSVLLYKDYDERGFVQGLIQLKSEQLCRLLCNHGILIIEGAQLELMQSEVRSIGQLKRRYSGNFSIFEPSRPDHPPLEEALDCELQQKRFIYPDNEDNNDYWAHMDTVRGVVDNEQRERVCADSESPIGAQDFTPETEFTPSTDIYCDEKATYTTEKQPPFVLGTRNPGEFATFVPGPQNVETLAPVKPPIRTHKRNMDYTERTNMWPNTATFVPMDRILPMVASSTIIVDNIESAVKENLQSQLERLDDRLGGCATVDIVRVGQKYRAFICYPNPNQAHASLSQFRRYYAGSQVDVRFA